MGRLHEIPEDFGGGVWEVVGPNSEPMGSVIGIALGESQGNVRKNRGYRG